MGVPAPPPPLMAGPAPRRSGRWSRQNAATSGSGFMTVQSAKSTVRPYSQTLLVFVMANWPWAEWNHDM